MSPDPHQEPARLHDEPPAEDLQGDDPPPARSFMLEAMLAAGAIIAFGLLAAAMTGRL